MKHSSRCDVVLQSCFELQRVPLSTDVRLCVKHACFVVRVAFSCAQSVSRVAARNMVGGSCQIWLRICPLFAGSMTSARKSAFMLVFMSVSVPCFCAPHGTALRQQVKDMAHPTTLDTSLGEYDRKTQSPMIWMNLHKSDLSSSQSNSGVSEERQ